MAVTIPLPVSDPPNTFSSDFGEVDSSLEGTTVEELMALIRPISLTKDVPQKDEEYFVTYCKSERSVLLSYREEKGRGSP